MWSKEAVPRTRTMLQAQRYMDSMHPGEQHGIPSDCMNPKCDYHFTPEDEQYMEMMGGWFTCPKCGWSFNYLDSSSSSPGGYTRAGLSMTEMGDLGESIVIRMGTIPGVGQVLQTFPAIQNPIDAIIGPYGVEIKTNHSESTPRFRMAGGTKPSKIQYCQANNLTPAMIGVRLNFYTDKADIFFRIGFKDTWIGSQNLKLISTQDFSDLNPFPQPGSVPSPQDLPEDDDSDIPF